MPIEVPRLRAYLDKARKHNHDEVIAHADFVMQEARADAEAHAAQETEALRERCEALKDVNDRLMGRWLAKWGDPFPDFVLAALREQLQRAEERAEKAERERDEARSQRDLSRTEGERRERRKAEQITRLERSRTDLRGESRRQRARAEAGEALLRDVLAEWVQSTARKVYTAQKAGQVAALMQAAEAHLAAHSQDTASGGEGV